MFVRDDGQQADLPAPGARAVRTNQDVYGPYPSGVPSPYAPKVHPYPGRVHGPIYVRDYPSLPWVPRPAENQSFDAFSGVEARPAYAVGPHALTDVPQPRANGGMFGRGASYGGGIFDGAMGAVGVLGPGALINFPKLGEQMESTTQGAVAARAAEIGNNVITRAAAAQGAAEGAVDAASAAVDAAKGCHLDAVAELIKASDDLHAQGVSTFQSATVEYQELAELAGEMPFEQVVTWAAQAGDALNAADQVLTGTDTARKAAIAAAQAEAAKCGTKPPCPEGEGYDESGKCVPLPPPDEEVTKAGFGMGWLLLGAAFAGGAYLLTKKKRKRHG